MRVIVRLAAVAVLVGVLAMPSRAEAAKVPIIFTSGQESFESGPLPPPYDTAPELAGASAGYVCDVSGVFWSYYAIDNCKAAAIRDGRFDDSGPLAAAIEAAYPAPDIPFWAAHGWKLMAGIVGLALVLAIVIGLRRSSDDDDERPETGATRLPATNLPMPETPYAHAPIGAYVSSYANAPIPPTIPATPGPPTTLGHTPAHYFRPPPPSVHDASTAAYQVPPLALLQEEPTVAYGTNGRPAAPVYVPPPYMQQPYVHQPYVQRQAHSGAPPRWGHADDGPTAFDPDAGARAEAAHAQLARGSRPK